MDTRYPGELPDDLLGLKGSKGVVEGSILIVIAALLFFLPVSQPDLTGRWPEHWIHSKTARLVFKYPSLTDGIVFRCYPQQIDPLLQTGHVNDCPFLV